MWPTDYFWISYHDLHVTYILRILQVGFYTQSFQRGKSSCCYNNGNTFLSYGYSLASLVSISGRKLYHTLRIQMFLLYHVPSSVFLIHGFGEKFCYKFYTFWQSGPLCVRQPYAYSCHPILRTYYLCSTLGKATDLDVDRLSNFVSLYAMIIITSKSNVSISLFYMFRSISWELLLLWCCQKWGMYCKRI